MGVEKLIGKAQGMINGKLIDIKRKAKVEGKKKILALRDKLPSEDQIKEKLKHRGCKPGDKKKMEAKFKKIKKFLENMKKKLNGALKILGFLKGLIDFLGKILKIILAILAILLVLLVVLVILIIVAKIVVKFLGGTFTGGLIDFLSRAIVKGEQLRDKWKPHLVLVKRWVKAQFNKYIKPVIKILGIAIAAVVALVAAINFLLSILELLFVMALQKCAIGEEKLGADTNTQDGGGSGDGSGDQNAAAAAAGLIAASSPEEIIARLGATGKKEYIRYITNANFQTIGYERFYAAIGANKDRLAGKKWPIEETTGQGAKTSPRKTGDMKSDDIYRPGDVKITPPKEDGIGNIARDIENLE